jgi:hypothetical protein
MRIVTSLLLVVCWAHGANAQEPCAAEKALIDQRLSQAGYSAEQRAQAEQMKQLLTMLCSAGGPQGAAMISEQIDQLLPPPAGEGPASGLTKDDLTNAYLQGQWCREGQEATSYDFAADGSYRYAVIGFNVAANGHLYFPGTKPKSEFLDAFDQLESKDDAQFVTSLDRRGRRTQMTFKRGACSFVAAGGAG